MKYLLIHGQFSYTWKRFEATAKCEVLTISEEEHIYPTTLDFLGYIILHNTLNSDSERLILLLNLPTPADQKSLKRIASIFSYYTKWISNFSDKMYPLNDMTKFSLNNQQVKTFESLNAELANASIQMLDENIPFTVEMDAADFAISVTLNQDGRPVAFHSYMLQVANSTTLLLKRRSKQLLNQFIIGDIFFEVEFSY